MIGKRFEDKQSDTELKTTPLLVDMAQMGFLEPGIDVLTACGIGPCFVFVAFYQARPLAIYYWGGPSSNVTLPLEQLIGIELDKFRFKITEKSEALALPDFEDSHPDGDEPIDILPIGGQSGSQAVVDALRNMSNNQSNRIMSTSYLMLTTDMDYLDLCVNAQGVGEDAIVLKHVLSQEQSIPDNDDDVLQVEAARAQFTPYFTGTLSSANISAQQVQPVTEPVVESVVETKAPRSPDADKKARI